MSDYTNGLTAEQLIQYIANDRPELSREKMEWQRNHYIEICRKYMEKNMTPDYDQIDAIVLRELHEQYKSFQEFLNDREEMNPYKTPSIFSTDKETDIAEIKKYLNAFDLVISWNMSDSDYEKWKNVQ